MQCLSHCQSSPSSFTLHALRNSVSLICLAPELDRKYEKLYAYLQDDVTRKKPSADLVLNLLCQTLPERLAARAVFHPRAPLLKYQLLQMTDASPGEPGTSAAALSQTG